MSWFHTRLQSTSAAKINLDFEKRSFVTNSNKPSRVTEADNVWANVSRKDLKKTDQVRLVITTESEFVGNSNSGNAHSTSSNTQIVDLKYAGKHRFTAELADLLLREDGYGGQTKTRQRVAVVINGEWQTDPVGATHDFNVDLYNTGDHD